MLALGEIIFILQATTKKENIIENKKMDINLIIPYEKNAKKHDQQQIAQIALSIKEFGFNQPIVLDKDNVIIVGHGRYEAAKLLGLDDVPVITIDLDDKKAKAYRLADNRLNESKWDMELVIKELREIGMEMVELTGFKDQQHSMEIEELAEERAIDEGKYLVLTVEAPEAPRLKARASFYFDDIKTFNRLKKYFALTGSELDTAKLIKLIDGE